MNKKIDEETPKKQKKDSVGKKIPKIVQDEIKEEHADNISSDNKEIPESDTNIDIESEVPKDIAADKEVGEEIVGEELSDLLDVIEHEEESIDEVIDLMKDEDDVVEESEDIQKLLRY